MIKVPSLSKIVNQIRTSRLIDVEMLNDDIWRLENAFFGSDWRPYAPQPDILLIGARSGLEIALALWATTAVHVYVVESCASHRETIESLLPDRVHCFASVHEFLASKKGIKLSGVRVDVAYFDADEVTAILENTDVQHISCEMNEDQQDPLALYRFCQSHVDSFYLYMFNGRYGTAGRRMDSSVPEVSVVVAAYGVEAYLDECIQSLVSQTMKNLEIIIVDDGSKDRTGILADEWQKRFPQNVRVIHKENGGCASARNVGLLAARGEYVAFVDGDDWVEPPMYEDLYRAAALRNAEIGQCGFYEFYRKDKKILHPTAYGADGPNGTTGLVIDPQDYLTLMPSIWRRIYKRSYLKQYGIQFPAHIRRHDDLPFAFLTISRARRISVIPDCYYAYRLNRPGQDVSATDRRMFIHFEIFSWLYSQVRPWASARIMEQMKRVEIGTHAWILSRLDQPLRPEYLQTALAGIETRYNGYDVGFNWKSHLQKAAENKEAIES
ncbi:glycosyltransferase [Zymomonas mobilis]|uniref:glycosyltransferase n=1 Tax=Zymomonas mobilis TaxID=542 RepID=UPI0039E86994